MTDPQDTTPNAVGDDRAGYPPYRRWVKALAVALVVTTFMLLALGGQVTSEEAGMAVPDGFTTFGTWSLIAPLETWWHQMDTRLEHTHRLMGYVVGILAIGLMVSLLMTQGPRLWVKLLGIGVLLGVIGQGLLGILRVDEVSLFLAGVHGVTGQLFLCLTVLAAAAVGRFWMTRPTHRDTDRHRRCLRVLPIVLLVMLFLQPGLGSAVRHGGAALAIPDWPTHYGSLVPPMDQTHIDQAVAALPADAKAPRFDPDGDGTYQAWQVHLHFTHRLGAYLIAGFGLWFVAFLWRSFPGRAVCSCRPGCSRSCWACR